LKSAVERVASRVYNRKIRGRDLKFVITVRISLTIMEYRRKRGKNNDSCKNVENNRVCVSNELHIPFLFPSDWHLCDYRFILFVACKNERFIVSNPHNLYH